MVSQVDLAICTKGLGQKSCHLAQLPHRLRRVLKKSAANSDSSLSLAFTSDDIVEHEQNQDFFSCSSANAPDLNEGMRVSRLRAQGYGDPTYGAFPNGIRDMK